MGLVTYRGYCLAIHSGDSQDNIWCWVVYINLHIGRARAKEFMSPGARVAWFGIHDPAGKFTARATVQEIYTHP